MGTTAAAISGWNAASLRAPPWGNPSSLTAFPCPLYGDCEPYGGFSSENFNLPQGPPSDYWPETTGVTAKALWNSGLAAYMKNDLYAALRLWRQCARVEPSNANCLRGASELEDAFGLPKETALPDSVFEGRRIGAKHWSKGLIAYQKGDLGASRKEWESCRKADPDNMDCVLALGRVSR